MKYFHLDQVGYKAAWLTKSNRKLKYIHTGIKRYIHVCHISRVTSRSSCISRVNALKLVPVQVSGEGGITSDVPTC